MTAAEPSITVEVSLDLAALPRGFRLRDFILEERIGKGGFGVVYRARRGDRSFALKLPLLDLTSAEEEVRAEARAQLPRIDREIASLMSIRHPGVITVTEFFAWDPATGAVGEEGGLPIIVMPYVQGAPLDKWVQQRRPSLRAVLAAFRAIASALGEVHARSFVHRDIKPANILMGEGGPVLIDFGIARGHRANTATASGTLIGTTEYFAPEYVAYVFTDAFRAGQTFPYGPAQDFWALGHTFYKLLAGASVWAAYDDVSSSRLSLEFIEILKAGAIPPPSAVNPSLPAEVDSLVLGLLARSVDERFATGEAVARAVEALLESLPVERLDAPLVLPQPNEARVRAKASVVAAAARAARDAHAVVWRYVEALRRLEQLPFDALVQLALTEVVRAGFAVVPREDPARELLGDAACELREWAEQHHGNARYGPGWPWTPTLATTGERRLGELFSRLSLHRPAEPEVAAALHRILLVVRAVRLELQFRTRAPVPRVSARMRPRRPLQLLVLAGARDATLGARCAFADLLLAQSQDFALPLTARAPRSWAARRRGSHA